MDPTLLGDNIELSRHGCYQIQFRRERFFIRKCMQKYNGFFLFESIRGKHFERFVQYSQMRVEARNFQKYLISVSISSLEKHQIIKNI